jgi:hypothetical protein
MPAYTMKKLPEDLEYCFRDILDQRQEGLSPEDRELRATILSKFQREIVRRQSPSQLTGHERSDLLRDWLLHEINLEQAWNGFKQIRLFTYTNRKPRETHGHYQSVLILKSTDNSLTIHCLDHSESYQLSQRMAPFLHRRRLGVLHQREIDKSNWDGLSVYAPEVINFYRNQNIGTLFTLFHMLDKPHQKPYLIVDLGSGKGEIGEDFMRYIGTKGEQWGETYWINVDLSAENTEIAKKNQPNDRMSFITANAKHFVQKPMEYFEQHNLQQSLWNGSDIYVVASGFLTEGVISFADSIQILRALRTNPNVKGVFLTGLHASHISPYLAKQMGFQRVNANVDRLVKDALEIYQPAEYRDQVDRLLDKMNKHGALDLSYVSNLTEVLTSLQSINLSKIQHVFLAGVKIDESHVPLFDRLLEEYPSLLFWGASINLLEQSEFEKIKTKTKAPRRFIVLGLVRSAPLFSPFFFHYASEKTDTCVSSPLAHFMRGVTTDVTNYDPMPLHERILTARLFIELNRDETEDPIKNLLFELLKRETLAFKGPKTMDDLLGQVNESQVCTELKEAASDFLRLVPIRCYDFEKEALYTLQDSSRASHQFALTFYNEGQGAIAPEDWEALAKRYPKF